MELYYMKIRTLISYFLTFIFYLLPYFVYAEGFTLSSPDISGQLSNKQVFSSFGCTGENISPKFTWENAPKGTKSFAVTMYDPDAPTGSGWWHWLIFDISAKTNTLENDAGNIEKNIAPKNSIQSSTSFGQAGFGGACPPKGHGLHQYIFTVHALKIEKLGLKTNATPSLVGYYLNENTLAKSSLVAYYSR
jgi:Raf kinase inhibitor-like YbhB/YbcL family protein